MTPRFSDKWRRLMSFVPRTRDEIGLAIGWLAVAVLIGHGAFAMISQGKSLSQVAIPVASLGALVVAGTIRYVVRRRQE